MIKSLLRRFCITDPTANRRALEVMKLEADLNRRALEVMKLEADLKSFGVSDKAIEKLRELSKEMAYTTPATIQGWHSCLGRHILHHLWRRTVGLDSPR